MNDTVDWRRDIASNTDRVRRASLRRVVSALETFRDALAAEPEDIYRRVSEAMIPETDAILHELMELEGVPPYPHPMASGWWDLLDETEATP